MSVYRKLQEARVKLQNTKLKKSGKNKFAGYEYFELGDFVPAIQTICNEVGICGIISFTAQDATLTIHDVDGGEPVVFSSPMSSAQLKGCHDVQNLGAVQTYLRRYLWTNAFELVEHDVLDATLGAPVADKKINPKQRAELASLLAQSHTHKGQFLSHFEVDSLDRFPVGRLDEAKAVLTKKISKLNAKDSEGNLAEKPLKSEA